MTSLNRPSDTTPAAELARLTDMVRGLHPSWSNPEAYHIAKSEIAAGLARLARRLGQPLPAPVPAPMTPRVMTFLSGYACTCAGCGKPFRARRREQRHCSPTCRQRAFQKRRRDAKAA
jgi:hypothetical protein